MEAVSFIVCEHQVFSEPEWERKWGRVEWSLVNSHMSCQSLRPSASMMIIFIITVPSHYNIYLFFFSNKQNKWQSVFWILCITVWCLLDFVSVSDHQSWKNNNDNWLSIAHPYWTSLSIIIFTLITHFKVTWWTGKRTYWGFWNQDMEFTCATHNW